MMKDFHPKLVDALEKISKEPNYEEFQYKGYTCIVKRMMNAYSFFGNLNGYVILPKGHKLAKHYDEIDIDCHGGLTWSGEAKELFPQFTDEWVIGFDCSHYGDMQPFMVMREMFMSQLFHATEAILNDPFLTYKTFDYVKNECKRIVDQL
jgi:hypothetical protein